jgi:hypothetical protein
MIFKCREIHLVVEIELESWFSFGTQPLELPLRRASFIVMVSDIG